VPKGEKKEYYYFPTRFSDINCSVRSIKTDRQ